MKCIMDAPPPGNSGGLAGLDVFTVDKYSKWFPLSTFEFQNSLIHVWSADDVGGQNKSSIGRLMVLKAGDEYFKELVHKLLLGEPIVGHLHCLFVAIAIPDSVRDQLQDVEKKIHPLKTQPKADDGKDVF